MARSLTANQVLDMARGRHRLFMQEFAPDGVVLQQIDARQRLLLLRYGNAVGALINQTVSIATVIGGVLVGSDSGVPFYSTTFQDGWALHQTNDGVPYVDFSEPAIAGDPFGAHGGTPGFPLPDDFVKLMQVSATLQDSSVVPVDVVPEEARLERQRQMFIAFVSGNRLIPVRPLAANNSGDRWSMPITAITLSYIALPQLSGLSDVLTLPAVLIELLISGMAEHLSMMTPGLTASDKAGFAAAARRAEADIASFGLDVLDTATTTTVQYRR